MVAHLTLFSTGVSQQSCIALVRSPVPIAVRDDLHKFTEDELLHLSLSLSGFYLGLNIACT